MAWSLVTERKTGQIVFGRDSNVPLMLDSLWSPVSYNYVVWVWDSSKLVQENLLLHKVSWNPKPVIIRHDPANLKELQFDQQRGDLLQHVKRSVEKNRRPFLKNLEGQSEVYRLKVEEAVQFISGISGTFPMLEADTSLLNISIENAALLVMMKYQQQKQNFIESENKRRKWVMQILEATESDHLTPIRNELLNYERIS